MPYDIALVIPVFNESRVIERTLNSFFKGITDKVLFIVVDNGSTDNTIQIIRRWKRRSKGNLTILFEKKRGSMYARRKGLMYGRNNADIVLSTDADCIPLNGFWKDVKEDFVNQDEFVVLKGYQRQDSQTRLLKKIFLPRLMKLILLQEKIEQDIFGDFFFGGYFGIKSDTINTKIFNVHNIPLPDEPSVYWGRHAYYMGYKFLRSKNNMITSSRRFWKSSQTDKSSRNVAIRGDYNSYSGRIKKIKSLSAKEDSLINFQDHRFIRRLLYFLLDALFFRRSVSDSERVNKVISYCSKFMNIDESELNKLTILKFEDAKSTVVSKYEDIMNNALYKVKGYKEFMQ